MLDYVHMDFIEFISRLSNSLQHRPSIIDLINYQRSVCVSLAVVVALININKFHLRFPLIENGFILYLAFPAPSLQMDFQEQINCPENATIKQHKRWDGPPARWLQEFNNFSWIF